MAETLRSNITSSFSPLGLLQETNMEKSIRKSKKPPPDDHTKTTFPKWYDHKTGIYYSTHPDMKLPSDPFVDAVSYLFSHKHMGTTALIDSSSGHSIPYSKLPLLVKSMASGLHQMGIRKGDVVLILLPNSIFFPIVLMSVLSLGAILAPMNPLSNHLEIKKQTIDCNVRVAFTTPENVDKVESLGFAAIGVPENVMDINKDSIFNKIISSDPGSAPKHKIHQEDTAAIMFSSGTTGGSKGVVLTHKNMIAMMALFVRFEAFQYDSLPSDNVYLAILPMFHIFGLALFGMGLLSLGTSVVVMRRFDEDEMVKAIDRYKVTHLTVVPPLLSALTRKAKSGDECLKSLKQVSCGAAALSPKLIQDFLRTLPHVDFFQGYGMTESAAVATRGYNSEEIHNYTSVGLLAPNTQAKVVDWRTASSLPPGAVGELWLRTPAIMKGYLNNVEATKATVDENGWLHTGDIVCFDEHGYVYIVDRLKEIIKYKGFQIAPADLESILTLHPDVADAAVTAGRDEEAGEIPVAFVVRKKGSTLSEATLINFVASKVSSYKKVRKVVYTKSIPRTPAGKIIRRELKNMLQSRL